MTRAPTAILLAATVLVLSEAGAVGPRFRTDPPETLVTGDLDGIAVSSRGGLFLSPKLTLLSGDEAAGYSVYVWSVVADAAGNLYLGTGPDGRLVQVSPAGRESVLFSADEPMVTALALLPGGDVLAGTAPAGKIYRISPDGQGRLWCETGARYVWAIAVGAHGDVFAGTGERGIVYRIDDRGEATEFFNSNEPHIVSLATLPDGGILAGGAGSGTVYQIDGDGHALVLHDGDLSEVTGLAVLADGTIVASLLAPPPAPAKRPEVRIQVPGATTGGAAADQAHDLDDAQSQFLEGIIEGLLPETVADGPGIRGQIVAIGPGGITSELWRSATEAPFSLTVDSGGRLLFGTGEPARLYMIDLRGDVSLLASLDEAQATALLPRGEAVILATSNPATSYRVDWDHTEPGVYLSTVFDARVPVRWGTIRWRPDPAPRRVELYARSGNSAVPDKTWSGWSPAMTKAVGSPIDVPDGRFLQWRLKIPGGKGPAFEISNVTVSYTPYNRPPSIVKFEVEGGRTATRDTTALAWTASDPDGDPLEIEVQYRPPQAGEWSSALRTESGDPELPIADDASGSAGGRNDWDTASVPEGVYELRLRVSDAAGNHPGEGREVFSRPPVTLIVDRTPPVARVTTRDDDGIEVEITDESSSVAALWIVDNDQVRYRARPVDGVCDSRRETFRIEIPRQASWNDTVLKALDAAGNQTEVPIRE